jgi:hypothetical protein
MFGGHVFQQTVSILANSCVYFDFIVFNATLSNIAAISWRPVLVVEEAWSTRKDSPTMGKQLVSLISCGYESSAPFFYSWYCTVMFHLTFN